MYCAHCGREIVGICLFDDSVTWVHLDKMVHCNWPHYTHRYASPELGHPISLIPEWVPSNAEWWAPEGGFYHAYTT